MPNGLRTLAYIPLHYGKDYLKYVLMSIRDSVDDILILYTSRPSYGYASNISNPDTREELKAICKPFNVIWQDIPLIGQENQHRQLAYTYAQAEGYDLVLAVDADEIWNPGKVQKALEVASISGRRFNCISGNNWFHFWKGFNEVNQDGFYPMRIINMRSPNKEQAILDTGEIYHMGYAISAEAMEYKLSCHGHKSEIPHRWLADKWLNYQKGVTTHLHPASQDVWIETKPFEGVLPELLKGHEYYE